MVRLRKAIASAGRVAGSTVANPSFQRTRKKPRAAELSVISLEVTDNDGLVKNKIRKDLPTMELIIEHSETKRTINGPLNINGKYEDLMWLAECIINKIKDDKKYHGWIDIPSERPNTQSDIVNTPSKSWD